MEEIILQIQPFLENGRLNKLPKKKEKRKLALIYIFSKFEEKRKYTEIEINEIIKSWHTFNDHAIIRRALCDEGLLCREDDGRIYYKILIINSLLFI